MPDPTAREILESFRRWLVETCDHIRHAADLLGHTHGDGQRMLREQADRLEAEQDSNSATKDVQSDHTGQQQQAGNRDEGPPAPSDKTPEGKQAGPGDVPGKNAPTGGSYYSLLESPDGVEFRKHDTMDDARKSHAENVDELKEVLSNGVDMSDMLSAEWGELRTFVVAEAEESTEPEDREKAKKMGWDSWMVVNERALVDTDGIVPGVLTDYGPEDRQLAELVDPEIEDP